MSEQTPWVVVSGAGGALGSELAMHYAGKGRRVLALDKHLARIGLAAGQQIVAQRVDLLSEQQVSEALDGVLGGAERVSLLINAVGRIWNEPILSFRGAKLTVHTSETWREVVEANLTAPFIVASGVAARMARRGGGSIVNFSSIASAGNSGQAAYSAAKAGVEGLTRTMGLELGPLGVRVNALALGFIDVETTRAALSADQLREYADRTPLGRLGRLEDVIRAVEFLEANAFVNGSVLKIDGGVRL